MKASKLFHAVVVLGMSIAAESACSSDDPTPTTNADAGKSDSTDKTGGADKTDTTDKTASDAGSKEQSDAFAGWSLCG